MGRPLLSLVAIVKDEAKTIRETLASLKPYVDRWCVLDTGSTDGTQAIVRDVLSGAPGFLFEEPFVDFATSRNRVLDVHYMESIAVNAVFRDGPPENPSEFTLVISGDETLCGGAALRDYLEARRGDEEGAYCVEIRSGTARWYYPRVLRTGAGWRYVGEVHEVPVGPNQETSGPLVPDAYIVHEVSDPEKRIRRVREYDLPILTRIVADESRSVDDRAQAIFHLADAHGALAKACGDGPGSARLSHQMAAMALYRRYAKIAGCEGPGHDPIKAGYARFRDLLLAAEAEIYTSRELVDRLASVVREVPWLPEARVLLAYHAARVDARRGLVLAEEAVKVAKAGRGKVAHVPTDDGMEWQAYRIAAGCARFLGQKKKAREMAEAGIAAGGAREAFKEHV